MLEFAIAIANMARKECTAEYVQELIKEHGYYCSMAGEKLGYEEFFHDKDGKWIILSSLETYQSIKDSSPGRVVMPYEANYELALWTEISRIQDELILWFDDFIEGIVPFERLSNLCNDISPKVIVYGPGADQWHPDMGMTFSSKTLFDYILSREIIWPFFRKEGGSFKRVRKCPECGKYFYAEDTRKVFCSGQCKGLNFYRAKKNKSQKLEKDHQ